MTTPPPILAAFTEALTGQFAGSVVTRRQSFDWHSAGYSGQRCIIHLLLPSPALAAELSDPLLEAYDFTQHGLLVVDIVLAGQSTHSDGSVELILEALLLDDDVQSPHP